MKFKRIAAILVSLPVIFPVFAATSSTDINKNDAKIVEILIVLNKNEINTAQLALKKSTNKLDQQFAELMVREHGENLHQTLKISKEIHDQPAASITSESLKKEGEKSLAELKTLNSNDFNKAYIDAMVTDHKKALELIDSDLLANVSNTTLKKHLEETRIHVDHHLQKAMEIQRTM